MEGILALTSVNVTNSFNIQLGTQKRRECLHLSQTGHSAVSAPAATVDASDKVMWKFPARSKVLKNAVTHGQAKGDQLLVDHTWPKPPCVKTWHFPLRLWQ